ncbi:hypothetical protein HN587_01710 [Candidatus Woesearchaeota archaeon]|nr:hypothetical protein [Candidatus Woesearchaeota archaeon]
MLIFLDLLTNISQLILIGITLVLIHLAWFLYFDKSKRLIELFPIETRTHSKLDLIILSAFSLLIAATVILTEIVRFTHN